MPLSTAAIRSLISRESGDAIIILLTLTHPTIEILRVARNIVGQDIVSRGETYKAFPFDVTLPSDDEDVPRVTLRIANVDRRISFALMELTSPPLVAFEIIEASQPDIVLRRYARFELQNITWDAMEVQGDLAQASLVTEPWPNIRCLPSNMPAMFRK